MRKPTKTRWKHTRDLGVALSIGALVTLLLWQSSFRAPGIVVGAEAPSFSLKDIHTQATVSLDTDENQAVLVVFWATWCAPCVRELPELEKLRKNLSDRPISIVSIVDQPRKAVLGFLKKMETQGNPIGFPVAIDQGGRTHVSYGVDGLPFAVLVAPDRTIARLFFGSTSTTTFKRAIEDVLQ